MDLDSIRADLQTVCGEAGTPGGAGLRETLSRLDEAAEKASLPPDLKHYLEKRSYRKALEKLDNPGMPHAQ